MVPDLDGQGNKDKPTSQQNQTGQKSKKRTLTKEEWSQQYSKLATNGFNPFLQSVFPTTADGMLVDGLPFCPVYTGNLTELASHLNPKRPRSSKDSEDQFYFTSNQMLETIRSGKAYLEKRITEKAAHQEKRSPNVPAASHKSVKVLIQKNQQVPMHLEKAGYTWCFATDTRTVRNYVVHLGKWDILHNRVAQLFGWQDTLANISMADPCNSVPDIYTWANVLLNSVWNSMESNIDTNVELDEQKIRQPARSLVANVHLFVSEHLALAVWLTERCAYTSITSGAAKHQISRILEQIQEAMQNIPLWQPLDSEIIQPMTRRLQYSMAQKAKEAGFGPYHYFAGQEEGSGLYYLK